MKWGGLRGSDNLEDRRGSGGGRRVGLGGGIGGLVLVLLLSVITGRSPLEFLGLLGGTDVAGPSGADPSAPAADDAQTQFMRVVLADTEDTWDRLFEARQARYEHPVMVLFTGETESACGLGQAAMGPFYCPGDRKVYLDLSFFQDLDQRFGAPGDFAQAYVVAHEVGHHVQTLTGLSDRVSNARRQAGEVEGNALSVRQELQADCYAGVWGFYAAQKGLLESGDVEEGLRAAAAIGDDRLQRQAQGRVVPESFTHGSSAQRVDWFRRGLESGRIEACDTFANR